MRVTHVVKPRIIPTNARYEKFRATDPIISSHYYESKQSYEWRDVMEKPGFEAAPTESFAHAPLADVWAHICPGLKVEIINVDYVADTKDVTDSVYWLAAIISVSGYKVLLRYEGYGSESSHDIWTNLCSPDIHPIGWVAAHGKLLIPPRAIAEKISDWKSFMVKRLIGCRTLPSGFHELVGYLACGYGVHPCAVQLKNSIQCRFPVGTMLEATDRSRMDGVRPVVVKEVVGQRLRVAYVDGDSSNNKQADTNGDAGEDNDFWCSAYSQLLHPVGWAMRIGHVLRCSPEYRKQCADKLKQQTSSSSSQLSSTAIDWSPFNEPNHDTSHPKGEPSVLDLFDFQEGMKLEAVDPSDLGRITIATVCKVLKDHYMMIKFDGTTDSFCYHRTSPFIFPPGFCEANNIELTPPKGKLVLSFSTLCAM
ncbi:unnamed protein product [Soboliphyme baturini]|uniref:Lethal(3)malignant brain tumor-like protein 2 n=1 Tax=Soboliphyme baturini TaxID=241478 RepID=A0A183ITA3_9BILA|nr:unnamed protein product [Soboliphyme baturini]